MKTTFAAVTFMAVVLALTSAASAQTYPPAYSAYDYPGWGWHHASTYEEGLLRGYGALATSIGQANYFDSLARINNEEARAKYMKNRVLAAQTYFKMREYNTVAREAMRPDRLTTEEYVALAKREAPDRLTHQQYDTMLGRLHWPVALMADQFAAERDGLDRAFRTRSPGDVGPNTAFYAEVRQLTSSMEATLKANISQLEPAQYVAAKKFLMGVSYEAQQPMEVRGLAL